MPYQRKDSAVWWVSYVDASGKRVRRSTGTVNRKEAVALKAKWILDVHHARTWGKQPSRTFDEVLLQYLKSKVVTAKIRSTVKPLRKFFGGRTIQEVTVFDVKEYGRSRLEEDKVTAGTFNKEVGLLCAAINFCNEEYGWELPNPASEQKLSEPEGRLRWITREEADKLVAAARKGRASKLLKDLIQLALHTGMRSGELLNLEWDRVYMGDGLIRLDAEHTKSRKRRFVPMNSVARGALISLLSHRAGNCPDSPWVFSKADGSKLGSVRRGFAGACKRAGIDDFRIHDLRHTCAAWLVSGGVPLAEVRDLLGHRSISTTERYAHLAPENVRRAVRTLERSHDLVTVPSDIMRKPLRPGSSVG